MACTFVHVKRVYHIPQGPYIIIIALCIIVYTYVLPLLITMQRVVAGRNISSRFARLFPAPLSVYPLLYYYFKSELANARFN